MTTGRAARPGGTPRAVEQARRRQARTVDDQSDEIAACASRSPRLAARTGDGGAGSSRSTRSRPVNASISSASIGAEDPLSTTITS